MRQGSDGSKDRDLLTADDHATYEKQKLVTQALWRCGADGLTQRCAAARSHARAQ